MLRFLLLLIALFCCCSDALVTLQVNSELRITHACSIAVNETYLLLMDQPADVLEILLPTVRKKQNANF